MAVSEAEGILRSKLANYVAGIVRRDSTFVDVIKIPELYHRAGEVVEREKPLQHVFWTTGRTWSALTFCRE